MTQQSRRQPPPYHVRLARAGEEDQVCAVCTEGYLATAEPLLRPDLVQRQVRTYYNPVRVRQEIADAGATPAWLGYVVASSLDGRVLGAAGGGIRADGNGHLYVLYLQMDLRGAGIGTALLDFVTAQHRDLGAGEQWVSVLEGNHLGIPFYRAKGFVERGREPYAATEDGTVEAYSLLMSRAV